MSEVNIMMAGKKEEKKVDETDEYFCEKCGYQINECICEGDEDDEE